MAPSELIGKMKILIGMESNESTENIYNPKFQELQRKKIPLEIRKIKILLKNCPECKIKARDTPGILEELGYKQKTINNVINYANYNRALQMLEKTELNLLDKFCDNCNHSCYGTFNCHTCGGKLESNSQIKLFLYQELSLEDTNLSIDESLVDFHNNETTSNLNINIKSVDKIKELLQDCPTCNIQTDDLGEILKKLGYSEPLINNCLKKRDEKTVNILLEKTLKKLHNKYCITCNHYCNQTTRCHICDTILRKKQE